jgi:hypothetical protein
MILRIEPRPGPNGTKYLWIVSDVPYGIALARGVNWTEKAARAEAARKIVLLETQRELEGFNV